MLPSLEIIALNRMAFGPRPGDVERVRQIGFPAFVDEQLKPDDSDDPLLAAHLKSARLHIQYDAGQDDQNRHYFAVNEDRALVTLEQSAADLWKLLDPATPRAGDEYQRPVQEVRAATYLRAAYSKWQLREVLVDFWHNHFSIDTSSDNARIPVLFPVYDRDVIRKHALGNFRQFLEAVCSSVPMLAYLNNAASKASPANENFARELLESHTLGREAYLSQTISHWRDVPGAAAGNAAGFIDEDVNETARAFTGWTIADGTDSGHGETFPNTGEFHYCESWHDTNQKRVLGVDLDANQPSLADGRKVFDLLAYHPATAAHLCAKLCRRLVSDDPPPALVQRAVVIWMANRDKPNQIAQTVRAILLSKEFASAWGEKVKRPFELVVSFLRATDGELRVGNNLFGFAEQMGQHLFAWPTPAGHPDEAENWLGSNTMLCRLNLPGGLLGDAGSALFRLGRWTPLEANTWRKVCAFWMDRLLSRPLSAEAFAKVLKALAGDDDPDQPIMLNEKDLIDRVQGVVTVMGMTPEFQER